MCNFSSVWHLWVDSTEKTTRARVSDKNCPGKCNKAMLRDQQMDRVKKFMRLLLERKPYKQS